MSGDILLVLCVHADIRCDSIAYLIKQRLAEIFKDGSLHL